MNEAILVLNAGSSSVKFAVYETAEQQDDPVLFLRGQVAGIGHEMSFSVTQEQDESIQHLNITDQVDDNTHKSAINYLLDWLQENIAQLDVVAAGHRVVHGGQHRRDPELVSNTNLQELRKLIPLAPHHQPHNLKAIEALAERDSTIKQVACFDTAFHATQDIATRRFALPKQYENEGILRYGFHGLSYEYISDAIRSLVEKNKVSRVLIAHLGNGASLCAVKDGQSVATTMGFSTIDGVMMGTRCGAIDPGVLLHLMREYDMGEDELTQLLYNQSGLLGASGKSADMRDLLSDDDTESENAVDLYIQYLIKSAGSMIASMQGVDAIVFTGGVGEHADIIRQRFCDQMSWLGVELDRDANARHERVISGDASQIAVWVVPTNEELVIARHTTRLIN